MVSFKTLCTTAVIAAGVMLAAPRADQAQVSFGVNVGGPAPGCPYGYFDYAPYDCAPYGYYGPDWFNGGIFIGAGPWFHGPRGFYGHVDNRFDPHNGYRGPLPGRGDQAYNHFRGNEGRDGQGHIGNPGHGPEGEHMMGGPGGGHPGGGGGAHGGGGHR
ncbi:hypothetical protein [Terriglobus roseus]|uniref:Uncharacterized protein n=1 Tax=Terriglobus roseus TaxID=392734 RepID=A0A1H4LZ68_9BACT|nr:hypothetical protein [Terriglobus roseus]SEB76069.1 hypothetical protein SAMN05443244_1765 [Terriglobus roseus]